MNGPPVALVTGASAGLGAEFARQLSHRGYRLLLTARRAERLEALAAELGNARIIVLDLERDDAARELFDAVRDEEVETLVNNAGFGLKGRVSDQDPARLRGMIDLNCRSLTDLCRLFADQMIGRGRGRILNLASTAAFQPGPGMAVYFATKAYVLSFTEALHEELKPHGIKVSALCPGPTRTEFGEVAGFGRTGAFDRLAMAAGPVVTAGLDGLDRNSAIVVPGLLNRVGSQASRFLPRALVRKAAGRLKL